MLRPAPLVTTVDVRPPVRDIETWRPLVVPVDVLVEVLVPALCAWPLTTWPRLRACTSPFAFISLKTRPQPSLPFMLAIWSRVKACVPLWGCCELNSDCAIRWPPGDRFWNAPIDVVVVRVPVAAPVSVPVPVVMVCVPVPVEV